MDTEHHEPDPNFRAALRVVERSHQDMLDSVREQGRLQVEAVERAEAIRTGHHEREVGALKGQVRLALRGMLVTIIMLIVVVAAGLAAFAYQLSETNSVVAEQQAARMVALVDRCRQSNALESNLQHFIRIAVPRLSPLAERLFVIEPNCALYAQRLLNADKPPPLPKPHKR